MSAPEVTSPAPINSTTTRMEPRPWPPHCRTQAPYPHWPLLPNQETFSCPTRNSGTKGRGNTMARCLGGL